VADATYRAHHVLENVGAGERTAQLGRKAEADDGEDFVEALKDASGNPGSLLLPPAGEVMGRDTLLRP